MDAIDFSYGALLLNILNEDLYDDVNKSLWQELFWDDIGENDGDIKLFVAVKAVDVDVNDDVVIDKHVFIIAFL